MGSCVSVHKNPDSAMKLGFSIDSKTDKLSIPSPTKEKRVNGEHHIAEFDSKSQSSTQPLPLKSFRDFGSKEESFFDSQPWLESDCEDDFFSVNGDLIPSHGSTPIHQSSFIVAPEPSPTNKTKRLVDLFRESFGDDQFADYQNISDGKLESKPTNMDPPLKFTEGTPYLSGANSVCSSERTPNKDAKLEKEKSERAAQCCLPNLVRSLSFNERKKRLISGRNGGG